MVHDATDGSAGACGRVTDGGDGTPAAAAQRNDHPAGGVGGSAAQAASDAAGGQDGRPGHGGHGGGHGAGRRVLVIEDEPHISEAIRFILRRDGWAVAVHDNGETALASVREHQPDIVVLDVMLPGASGYEVLRQIRADPGLTLIPVILLTAKGQTADREMARASGASLYMTKPFANAELLAAVRQLART